jgi:hypothetical protein
LAPQKIKPKITNMKNPFLLAFVFLCFTQLALSQEYTILSKKTSDLWIYPGITMDVVPYGEINSTGGAFIGVEKYFNKFAINALLTFYMPTEIIKKAGANYGNVELGGQYNISDNSEEKNIQVTIRKESAGYQKVRIYYYDVPTDRRIIKAIRGGIISNPYADGVYAGWSFTNIRNVTVASTAFKNGKKSSSTYMKFGADIIATYHRSDFYERFIGNSETYENPSTIGFRTFGALKYASGPFENIMVSVEFGKRDSWYINMGLSYLINNIKK